jgi:hypothetical protein
MLVVFLMCLGCKLLFLSFDNECYYSRNNFSHLIGLYLVTAFKEFSIQSLFLLVQDGKEEPVAKRKRIRKRKKNRGNANSTSETGS